MLCALALLASAFPGSPLADQVALGRSLALREPTLKLEDLFRSPEPRSALSAIWGDDLQAVGLWSNGYRKVAVEDVLWLSPGLVSRWLGFLSAREHWEDGVLDSRWARIAAEVGDRRMFLVKLSAFPKMPTYGIGDVERATTEEIENVRFVYTADGRTERMEAERIAQWQSRERSALEDFPWWQYVTFGRQLQGEFELPAREEPLPFGDYHRAWYLVWVTGVEDARFEVRVLSRRKERVAEFGRTR
jgi:hypothetical protein